MEVVAIETHAV